MNWWHKLTSLFRKNKSPVEPVKTDVTKEKSLAEETLSAAPVIEEELVITNEYVDSVFEKEDEVAEEQKENNTKDIFMETQNYSPVYSQEWIPVEFQYLENLIGYRLGQNSRPAFPDIDSWELPVKEYIKKFELEEDEQVCTVLLIALAPHAFPDLFDRAIEEKIKTSGDFPEIGGVRGKNFRGFLPTGQTASFLLADNDWKQRNEVEHLFWSDHELAKKKILWLEELSQGEPVLSGKLIMALDYVDLFLSGSSAPPHFGTAFPAKKIATRLGIDDIVMNKEIKRHFKNLEDWIHHNSSLMNEWMMEKRLKQGFRVLFYGPPGTGKTLAATVLGRETKKDVYKIDLSMVVSKYIGETEKNLELLFARAEDKNWILFFDEADAIFGKRTSVRDAHDKYANQEVSYLLQRIEDFNGLVILATNMKNNIDEAFIRRFNDIVKFSLPTEEERKEIWEKSFPENADYGDIPDKVKKYNVTGGNIINTIHYAGIQALKKRKEESRYAEIIVGEEDFYEEPDRLVFYLEDIIEGIRREMMKEGKPFVI